MGKGSSWRLWHSELIALINGDFSSRKLRLIAELVPELAFARGALQFVQCLHKHDVEDDVDTDCVSMIIEPCEMTAVSVNDMRLWLDRHVKDDIHSAILHGSLGTNEIVPYSDFDALVVIKDEVLCDAKRLARVAQALFQSRRFMYEQDPLQHHGWFVLPEQALRSWPEDYLPIEVLRHSVVLNKRFPVELCYRPVMDMERCERMLHSLLNAVKYEISTGSCFLNIYRFKSMISKVLLIPTIYVQVRDGLGVFKRNSFHLAQADFSASEWNPIEIVSDIRKSWPRLVSPFPCRLSQRPGVVGDKWRKSMSGSIDPMIKKDFSLEVQRRLLLLIESMKVRVSASIKDKG